MFEAILSLASETQVKIYRNQNTYFIKINHKCCSSNILAGYLDKSSVHWRGRPGMLMYSGVYTGSVILF